jgi:hypothetical protein
MDPNGVEEREDKWGPRRQSYHKGITAKSLLLKLWSMDHQR